MGYLVGPVMQSGDISVEEVKVILEFVGHPCLRLKSHRMCCIAVSCQAPVSCQACVTGDDVAAACGINTTLTAGHEHGINSSHYHNNRSNSPSTLDVRPLHQTNITMPIGQSDSGAEGAAKSVTSTVQLSSLCPSSFPPR